MSNDDNPAWADFFADLAELQNRLDREWARDWMGRSGLVRAPVSFDDKRYASALAARLTVPADMAVRVLRHASAFGAQFVWSRSNDS